MSDLTRRVLEAHQFIEDDTPPVDWNKFDDARRTLEHSAPTLARQIEAVEALADWLENEADAEAARGDTWDAQCIRDEGRRIRNALTEATKETDQ